MFNLDIDLWCLGALALGFLLGYIFAYSGRQQQPNGNEVAALLSTVLGGAALSLIGQFKQCPEALPLYVIGAAAGYLIYVFVLKRNWALIQHLFQMHGLQRAPLFPFVASDPCCNCGGRKFAASCITTATAVASSAGTNTRPTAGRTRRAEWVSPLGLDVSMWQDAINWPKVNCAGRRFAFIKATEGNDWADPKFAENWAAAKAAGVWRGAYHFFRPLVSVDAQIENFVSTVGSLEIGDLPPVLDLEVPEDWVSIRQADRVDLVLKWLHTVWQRLGVQPIIYLDPSFASDVLGNDARLAEFPLWIAHYTTAPSPTVPAPWTVWTFWQFSDRGTVPGISGSVDVDVFNGPITQLAKMLKQQA